LKTRRELAANFPIPATVAPSAGYPRDLGFVNPEQELLKARLVLQIADTIEERGLTQVEAAKILGVRQPHVSNLMRGLSRSFSAERLMGFLNALGHDIEIAVKSLPAKRRRGTGQLRFKVTSAGRLTR
jgi:predicted XRE-type DNA-binding protein